MSRSKQINKTMFQIQLTPIAFAPDEVWNIYVDISNDLHLDIQSFKLLIQKANSYV